MVQQSNRRSAQRPPTSRHRTLSFETLVRFLVIALSFCFVNLLVRVALQAQELGTDEAVEFQSATDATVSDERIAPDLEGGVSGVPAVLSGNAAGAEGAVGAPAMGLPKQIQAQWKAASRALQRNDLTAANEKLIELNAMKIRAGFESLESVSLDLIGRGETKLREGDIETASFLLRRALEISPDSPDVLLQSLSLAEQSGVRAAGSLFVGFLSSLLRHPFDLLERLSHMIYPALWALTVGLYVAFVLFFSAQFHSIMRAVARYLPTAARGVLTPLVTMTILCVPCLLGPLWVLFAWSVLLYLLLPSKRLIGLFAGLVLTCWGVGIQASENLSAWYQDSGVQAMLRISSGAFHDQDRLALEELVARRPDDGVALYTLGQLLRRYEEFDAAEAYLERAESALGSQPWTEVQLGMIDFLRGRSEQADEHFEQARTAGLNSAPFLFNFSKIKFDLLQTEASRDLLREANRTDPALAKRLQEREDQLGLRSAHGMAEIGLPFTVIFRSALRPIPGVENRVEQLASTVMPAASSTLITAAGVLIVVLFLLMGGRDQRYKLPSYYGDYESSSVILSFIRMIPGGAWAVAGRPVTCFGLISLFTFLVLPLIGWPTGNTLFVNIPRWHQLYVWLLAVLALVVLYRGTILEEER